ncbi:UPF0323 family lipoprotein [Helicobacter trogontum]|uniref:Motility protein n=1 Tax=Helicobacter trogontum TaxID=50960 RepID=A0A4U8TG01_9HELI|nr:UPF0323 family lipoprotein [Helicobacter trogontum]MCI5785878.1 UPF0323 family lipoprotein [Helicobacter trogontum]MDY5184847.1 UPF0323 family lipoprotein [Helicobacter trogontum]TLD99060.1 hypothetical protein LS80_002305 [Helicobacter trogontum]
MKKQKPKSYLRKISDAAILGGMSAVLVAGLLGCDSGSNDTNTAQQVSKKQGVTVILQEEADGSYKIVDEQPSNDGDTTIIVKDTAGNKRILSKEEVDALVAEEAKKIDNGTSTLTSSDGGGLGIGGAILASAAGALIGSYIGNKLFNNANYKANAQRGYSSPSAYQRSQANSTRATTGSSTTTTKAMPQNAKSGFFGGNTSSTATS